jgi:hypothetical protein
MIISPRAARLLALWKRIIIATEIATVNAQHLLIKIVSENRSERDENRNNEH